MSKASVSLIALTAMLAAPWQLRADPLPPGSSGRTDPNGYWTFKDSLAPANSGLFILSGGGNRSVGAQLNANSPIVFFDLTWQPDEFALGAAAEPAIVAWTALSAGEYTVTATVAPSQGTGGLAPRGSSGLALEQSAA
jgi:hypothetical protein